MNLIYKNGSCKKSQKHEKKKIMSKKAKTGSK